MQRGLTSLILLNILYSFFSSILTVASSSIRICGLLIIALARESLCFCPADNPDPSFSNRKSRLYSLLIFKNSHLQIFNMFIFLVFLIHYCVYHKVGCQEQIPLLKKDLSHSKKFFV